jgi:hypothetical protein
VLALTMGSILQLFFKNKNFKQTRLDFNPAVIISNNVNGSQKIITIFRLHSCFKLGNRPLIIRNAVLYTERHLNDLRQTLTTSIKVSKKICKYTKIHKNVVKFYFICQQIFGLLQDEKWPTP